MTTKTKGDLHMGHHHRDPEKIKKDKKIKFFALLMMVFSMIVLVPYLALEFFPFTTSIYAHSKVNISTMCYMALRIMLVLMPVAVVLPSRAYKNMTDKINLLGKMLTITSFFFFCGMVADIMSYNIFGGYIDTGRDPIMIKMLCGYVGAGGVFYCFVQGVFYLLLSKKIKGHKKDVVLLLAGAYITYILIPILLMLIVKVPFFTKDWYTWFNKNVYLWISNAFFLIGLLIATKSRYVWSEIVWK